MPDEAVGQWRFHGPLPRSQELVRNLSAVGSNWAVPRDARRDGRLPGRAGEARPAWAIREAQALDVFSVDEEAVPEWESRIGIAPHGLASVVRGQRRW